MWELDYKESWAPKNWCFWTVVLEDTLESLLDCKELKPVNPKRNQSWIFIGRADAEPETPILWLPDVKNWLTGKDPDAGTDGEGNGNPLQCSCLENPRDRGAWWAAVYAVAQSRTWLKRLSSSSSPSHQEPYTSLLASSIRGQTEEARRTTVPQWLKQKPHYRKSFSMLKQKVMSQMKGQDKTPEKQLNEVKIGNLLEKEFRIMIVKMILDLG